MQVAIPDFAPLRGRLGRSYAPIPDFRAPSWAHAWMQDAKTVFPAGVPKNIGGAMQQIKTGRVIKRALPFG